MSKIKRSDASERLPAVIIVDLSHATDVSAAWFSRADAKTARRIAKREKLLISGGDAAAVAEFAERLVEGRLDGETMHLPSVGDELARDIRAMVAPPSPASSDPEPQDLDAAAAGLAEAESEGLSPALDETSHAAPIEQSNGEHELSSAHAGSVGASDASNPAASSEARADGAEALETGHEEGREQSSEAPHAQGDVISLRGEGGQPPLSVTDALAAKTVSLDLTQALPLFWQTIEPGTMVLAADLDKKGEAECWYEAIVVKRTPDTFILRWRDFPRDGLLSRTPRHVGLLRPLT